MLLVVWVTVGTHVDQSEVWNQMNVVVYVPSRWKALRILK